MLYPVEDDFSHSLFPGSFCVELKSAANVIVSIISFSGCLSKLHGKDTDIYMLFLNPAALMKVFIISTKRFVCLFVWVFCGVFGVSYL